LCLPLLLQPGCILLLLLLPLQEQLLLLERGEAASEWCCLGILSHKLLEHVLTVLPVHLDVTQMVTEAA
jgi:hypothetical protein